MDCYWRSKTSVYRGLNTMIRQYQIPTDIPDSSVCVKYGIAVDVATPLSQVRFVQLKLLCESEGSFIDDNTCVFPLSPSNSLLD